MPSVSKQEYELLQSLKRAFVMTESNDGKMRVYRMRLFSEGERAALRHAIREPNGWECAKGCAGMMEELEMVQFESGGKAIDQIVTTL